MERLTGLDATMLHLEDRHTPMHTIKVVVLEGGRRPVKLSHLHRFLQPRLGYLPRLQQRVMAAPGLGARPFWVDDPDFNLWHHLSEVTLLPPGGRANLDLLCGRLALGPMDRRHPLWSMTLVHGLEGGQQAVILRLHHAISDGLAAINLFAALSTQVPGELVPERPVTSSADLPARTALLASVARESRSWLRNIPATVAAMGKGRRAAKQATHDPQVLPGLWAGRRTSFSANGGTERVCASATLDLGEVKQLAKAADTTINCVLHALIAGAMRRELQARGESTNRPSVAIQGVAAELNRERLWGNEIGATSLRLYSNEADPATRLALTAASCTEAVRRRRAKGFEAIALTKHYGPRVAPTLRAAVATWIPFVVNDITTANVPGPASSRFFGGLRVVEWISYAVAITPANVNLTAHSYDGKIALGLIATPAAMPQPQRFLEAVAQELALLRETQLGGSHQRLRDAGTASSAQGSSDSPDDAIVIPHQRAETKEVAVG